MSDNNASDSSSTESEHNVYLAALGLTANNRYVTDIEALADKAEQGIKAMSQLKGRIDTVVVRSNYELMQELESRMDNPALPDVEYTGIDWRRVLDDGPGFYEGEQISKGVMQEGDQPIAEILAEADEDFDADAFDLNDRKHRNNFIDYSAIPQERINRAKAYAMGKTDERAYNDYFESDTTVSNAIFLRDGTKRGSAAIEAADGDNPWVKFPTALSGSTFNVNCNESDDQIIDWARYLLETDTVEVEDLTDGQLEDLRARHTDDDLEYMGVSPATTETPETTADPVPEAAEAPDLPPVQAD